MAALRFDSRTMEQVAGMGCKAYIVRLEDDLYRLYLWNSYGGICENTLMTSQQLCDYFNHWSEWAGHWYHDRGQEFVRL